MGTNSFDVLFAPRSVALIGASARPGSVGSVTLANLRGAGFGGVLHLVNPKHASIAGLPCYPDVAHLPGAPDLAVIATPPDQVTGVIEALGARGTRAAVIITAGFGELGERGVELQRQIAAAAAAHAVRIVGPNCIGVMVPGAGLNASFAHIAPEKGAVAFVSQSGALITAVLDWAKPRGIGFSKVVSLGDMADVDFGDMLDYLSADAATEAILLYIEGISTGAGAFMAAARRAAASKPVIVLKVGRHAEAAKAAHSHTGALAGSDVVYDAALRRAGMLRVDSMPDMFDALETLALTKPQVGDRLTILTNGGGPGVLATDALIAKGGALAQLAPETIAKLNTILPVTWSHGNPVDMIGDAGPKEYHETLELLLADPNSDAILVLNCPTALGDPAQAAKAVIETAHARGAAQRNVFTSWLGEYSAAPSRALFDAARIPTYDTPDDAIDGFMYRVRFARSQALLAQTAPAVAKTVPDDTAAAAAIARALDGNRRWLDSDEVDAVLSAYHIPTPPSRSVANVEAAAVAAGELGMPVALKLRSPDITHKSDVGAVVLNLFGAQSVRVAALAMLDRVRDARPTARIDGFFVQGMVQRRGALELIAGLSVDKIFGPVVLFGQGGTAVERIADTSLELVPLDRELARAQMQRTRVWKLLQSYRGQAAADLDAIADVLVRLGDLILAHPQIAELDINPLLADARGAIAVDARIRVDPAALTPAAMLSMLTEVPA
ncbi:MAG TPA: acetate--CoA ligase family protein [Candidatus Acidoferrales bacterium]|nr:acetate--CoA ligase family protein [Candidatus Acidoferrales bacterium]